MRSQEKKLPVTLKEVFKTGPYDKNANEKGNKGFGFIQPVRKSRTLLSGGEPEAKPGSKNSEHVNAAVKSVCNEDSGVKEIAGDKFCNREEEYGNSCGYSYSLTPLERLACDYSCFPRLTL